MGCASGLARFVLIVFNLIFMLPSLACVGLGIFIVVSANQLFRIVFNVLNQLKDSENIQGQLKDIMAQEGLIRAMGYILIGFGAFLLIISFLGCAGAMLQSKCLLFAYSAFLFLLGGAKVALIVAVFVSERQFGAFVQDTLLNLQSKNFVSINEFNSNSTRIEDTVATTLINMMQISLDCCGARTVGDISNSSSWLESDRTWLDGQMKVPVTCCPVAATSKSSLLFEQRWPNIEEYLVYKNCPITGEGAHNKVCYQAAYTYVTMYLWPTFGAVCSLIVLELILMVFALCVACNSGDESVKRIRHQDNKV